VVIFTEMPTMNQDDEGNHLHVAPSGQQAAPEDVRPPDALW